MATIGLNLGYGAAVARDRCMWSINPPHFHLFSGQIKISVERGYGGTIPQVGLHLIMKCFVTRELPTYSPVVVVVLIGFIQIRGWREGGFMPKGTVISVKAKTNVYSPYLTRKLNFVGNIIIHKKYNVTQTDRYLTAYN